MLKSFRMQLRPPGMALKLGAGHLEFAGDRRCTLYTLRLSVNTAYIPAWFPTYLPIPTCLLACLHDLRMNMMYVQYAAAIQYEGALSF